MVVQKPATPSTIKKTPGPKLYFPIPNDDFSRSIPIEDLELSERANNALKRYEVFTVGDIADRLYSSDIARGLRNCGGKTVSEIYSKIFEWSMSRYKHPENFFRRLWELNQGGID